MRDDTDGWRARGLMQGFPPPPEACITRDNWNRFPQSIWSFQHARRLFRSRRIARARDAQPLLTRAVDFSNLYIENDDGERLDWASFLAVTHTDAFVVLKDGVLVYEHYARDMTIHTPHMAFSITKSLTGLVAEILAHEGQLDLNASVDAYVPELSDTAFGCVTLRDLMDMRDGVAFDETYANPDADIHRYSSAYWGPRHGQSPVGGVYDALLGFKDRIAVPGEVFRYKTPSGDVLGWAVQRAVGQSLGNLIETRIWQAIGAEDDAYMIVDQAGHEIAATGFNATARDVARLGLVLCEDGRQVIDTAVVDALRKGGDRAVFACAGYPTRPGWSYSSQWWHTHNSGGAFCALGVYGQRLYIDPGNSLVIVRLGSAPQADNTITDVLTQSAFDAIVTCLGQTETKLRLEG